MNPPTHSGRDAPSTTQHKDKPRKDKGTEQTTRPPSEQRIDKTLEDTFPASDPPPSTGGATRIDPSSDKDGGGGRRS